jgi:hypothetical protein
LIKPSPLTNQIVSYCLAVTARQTGVLLHAVCFMSNHWHGVLTDPSARLPEFLERFHRLFARAQNASLGRWENLWSSDKPSIVRLVDDADILEKMAYTIANPTAAGLVHSPHAWPGIVTHHLGESSTVTMPDTFFDPQGPLPHRLRLELTRPPIYPDLSLSELGRKLERAIERHVRDAHERLQNRGKSFLGAKAVLRQAFRATPTTSELRRNPHPRIAARRTPERVHALRQLVAFVKRYRDAWHAWRAGRRDVIFPAGTYALRIYARVACAPACPI